MGRNLEAFDGEYIKIPESSQKNKTDKTSNLEYIKSPESSQKEENEFKETVKKRKKPDNEGKQGIDPFDIGMAMENIDSFAQIGSIDDILSSTDIETELFKLKNNDKIFFLDFKNLTEQKQALDRMAYFIEIEKGTILTDEKLKEYIKKTGNRPEGIYVGHDYKAIDMATFFNKTKQKGIKLNTQELKILDMLLINGFISKNEKGEYEELKPRKVLISTSEDGPYSNKIDKKERFATIRHEMSHAEFFTNLEYKRACFDFWENELSSKEKEIILAELSRLGYDQNNKELIINEFQAYLWEEKGPGMIMNLRLIKDGLGGLKKIRETFLNFIEGNKTKITTFFDNPKFKSDT